MNDKIKRLVAYDSAEVCTAFEQNGNDRNNHNHPFNEHGKRLAHIKQIDNPHHFVHDGITVRVLFEGTADFNELVKGLFVTG